MYGVSRTEEQPLVSVVIPAYNAGGTLERLLDSVRGQSWDKLEIIVVDDGSTDDTHDVAVKAAEADARVRVIRQDCLGVSAARNAGLKWCTGKYIRFVDADDLVPKESIEQMVRRAETDGSELVIGGYTQYVKDLRSVHNLASRGETVSCDAMMDHLCSHANSYYYGVLWNKLFLRELVEKGNVRFEHAFTWGEDFAFVMDYLREVKTVSFMKEAVYDYIRSAGSTTVQQGLDSVRHPVKNMRIKVELYEHLKDMYKSRGLYEKYKPRLWMYLFRVGLW